MNYYFLLEDEKSLLKVLPFWLKYMGFGCIRVPDISQVKNNNYILQSGQGVTQLITKVLFDTIDTIQRSSNRIDKLVIILDSESVSVEQRKQEVTDKIKEKYDLVMLSFEIVIIVCNHCFETWLLGKPGLYPDSVGSDSHFYQYYNNYNIESCDPENMLPPSNSTDTIAQYHFHYFHDLMLYRKMRYTKKKPEIVAKEDYFNGLCQRTKTTGHIPSFKQLLDFIKNEPTVNSG